MHLLLVVGKGLLSESQLLLLNPDILVSEDQVPVHVFDLVYRGRDLQAEGHIGDLTVVLGDLDEASVWGESEALQQVLSKPEIETRVELRTQCRERCVPNRLARIAKAYRQIGAPLEPLLVREVSGGGVQRRGRIESTGRKNTVVITRIRPRKNRIEAGDERTAAER